MTNWDLLMYVEELSQLLQNREIISQQGKGQTCHLILNISFGC